MKKLLIATAALAVVAGTAQAQSSVSVYGILSSGYATQTTTLSNEPEFGNISVKNTNANLEGAQSGSRLGFRGTEDLGGGLKAGFVYELGASIDSGVAANRLGFVDLSSSALGTIRFGKMDGVVRQVYNSFTAHGNSGFAAGNVGASMSALGTTVGSMLAGYATPAGTRVYYQTSVVDLPTGVTGSTNQSGATTATLNNTGPFDTSIQTELDKYNKSFTKARSTYTQDEIDTIESKRDLGAQAAILSALQFGQAANRYMAMSYITPSFSGLTAQVQYGKLKNDNSEQSSTTVGRDIMSVGLSYTQGPLALSYGREVIKAGTEETYKNGAALDVAETKSKAKIDTFAAAYDAKIAKGFLVHTRKTVDGVSYLFKEVLSHNSHNGENAQTADYIISGVNLNNDTIKLKVSEVGVAVPVGKFTFVGSYSDGKVTGDAESDIKAYQLQANYSFSKNTKAYLMTGQTKLDDLKVKGSVLGVQHSF